MTERTDIPALATRAEAAEALRVSVRTVDRMIGAGELVAVHPTSRAVRVTVESIRAVLTPTAGESA